jgi:voltage-gated potassium channel
MSQSPSLPPLEDVLANIEAAPTLIRRATYKLFIVLITLGGLGVMFLFYFVPMPDHAREVLYFFNFTNSIILLFDFGVRLVYAPNKVRYLLPLGLCDLIGSLPGFPWLRLFRLPSLWVALHELRTTTPRAILHEARSRLAESTLLSGLIVVFLVTVVGGTAIVVVEAPVPGSNIKNGGDALWYAIVTISTVGYGDMHPITVPGRLIGSVMIIVGVGLFSVLTGYISTQFLAKPKHGGLSETQMFQQRVEALFEQQRQLAAADRTALEAQITDLRRQLEQKQDANP